MRTFSIELLNFSKNRSTMPDNVHGVLVRIVSGEIARVGFLRCLIAFRGTNKILDLIVEVYGGRFIH